MLGSSLAGICHTGGLSAAYSAGAYIFPHLSPPTEESHAYARVTAHKLGAPSGLPAAAGLTACLSSLLHRHCWMLTLLSLLVEPVHHWHKLHQWFRSEQDWPSDLSHWTSARKSLVFPAPDKRLPIKHGVSSFLPVTELYTFVLGAGKKRSNACCQKLPITKRTKKIIVEDVLPILRRICYGYPHKQSTFQSSWCNVPLWAAAVKWEESTPLQHREAHS